MGLPGAGKTTLANKLRDLLISENKKVVWLNADQIRKDYDDWDFSIEGRIRQSERMYFLSTITDCDFVIADFVAPLEKMRDNFKSDYLIWVDTIKESVYEDTNNMFEPPKNYNFQVTEQNAEEWSSFISKHLLDK
jgi:adenylylsulfate kinase